MSRFYNRNRPNDCKVYVGELGSGASKQDLEEQFSYYGHLRNVWVARNPPGFAFVEFEDPRDAEDSCRGLDGRQINGRRMRVEMSSYRPKRGRGPPSSRGRPFHPDDRCYECGDKGHYARDCSKGSGGGGGGGGGGGSKFSSSNRRRSGSRSRSPAREYRSRSRSHSRSPSKKNGHRSQSRSRSPKEEFGSGGGGGGSPYNE